MPLVASNDPAAQTGKVHSHRFPGANTALPFVNDDDEQLKVTQEFLKDGQVSVDVFGLVPGEPEAAGDARDRRGRAAAQHDLRRGRGVDELRRRAGDRRASARGGRPARPDGRRAAAGRLGAARGRGAHAKGRPLLSGWHGRRLRRLGRARGRGLEREEDLPLRLRRGRTAGTGRAGAHFYRSLQLDEHGNAINKRNAWATRSVAYVRLIPPGAADTVHYRLRIPEDCGDRITVKAKLNYRKFAWWNTQWAFAGVRDPEHQGYSIGPGHDDGRWVFTGDTSGLGQGQGDPRHPDHGDGRERGRDPGPAEGGARARRRAPPRRIRARAVERLRHRPAAPGRPEGRRGGLPEGHRDGADVRRRLGERRTGARSGRQPRRRRGGARSVRSRPTPRLANPLLPRRRAEEVGRLRRARRTCRRPWLSIQATASCSTSSAGSSS